jgi:hypothetical protein
LFGDLGIIAANNGGSPALRRCKRVVFLEYLSLLGIQFFEAIAQSNENVENVFTSRDPFDLGSERINFMVTKEDRAEDKMWTIGTDVQFKANDEEA